MERDPETIIAKPKQVDLKIYEFGNTLGTGLFIIKGHLGEFEWPKIRKLTPTTPLSL